MKTKDVIGVVLDLSLEYYGGNRIDNIIRKQLKDFKNELRWDFIFYLYDPEVDKITYNCRTGHFDKAVNDFVLPRPFDVSTALNHSLDCITDDADVSVLIVMTNRYSNEQLYHYKSMLGRNLEKDLECNVFLVGIGDNYDKDSFSSLGGLTSPCEFVHLELNELHELKNVLLFTLRGEDQVVAESEVVSSQKDMDVSDDSCETEPATEPAPEPASESSPEYESEVNSTVPISSLGFNPSGGFNINGDVETKVEIENDLCEQDKICKVGNVSLKTKGHAEVVVTAKKSVKSMKKTPRKSKKKKDK